MSLRRPAVVVAAAAAAVATLAGMTQMGRPPARGVEPLLFLVSLDGFRPDYLEKAPAPHLQRLAAEGVRAEGLIPAFPTKTFPNHYTIVTGLYPGHHGIVANDIYDAPTGRSFAMSKPAEVRDAMWWGGEPIWVTAERAGRRAGTMFWPGSEAAIRGVRPSEWRPYRESLSGEARVDQALAWLDLPPARRPVLFTLYFEDTDTAGHASGPDSDAVRRAISRVDSYVGRLLGGLERRGLRERANVVVVSDHGMAAAIPGQVLRLNDYISLSDVNVADINPGLGLFPAPGKADAVYRALVKASPHLRVYKRAESPASWHYRDHPRIPPIVGVVDEGWQIIRGTLVERAALALKAPRGVHGYDPSVRSMRGVLIASGPAFKRGVTVPPLENVHLYEVFSAVLGLTPAKNDGDSAVARTLLQRTPIRNP